MQTRITINGTNYDSDKIIEATYTHTVNSGQQLNVGVVASAQLVFKTEQAFTVGTQLTYWNRPHNTGSYTQIGIFTIKSVDVAISEYPTQKKWYTYTCYDNVSKLDRIVDGWYSARTYPVNLATVFTTLCSYCGTTGNSSFDANAATLTQKPFDVTNLNGKTIAGWIAQIAGGYVYADSTGTLIIRHYATSGSVKTLTYADYTKKQQSNFQVQAPTLIRVVKNDKGEFTDFGSGSPMLKISGNPLAYESQNTLPYISSIRTWMISYTPITVHLLEDYGINAGDRITVDGLNTIVMTKKIDKSGVTLSSTGVETRQEETELQNDFLTEAYLNQYQVQIDTTNFGLRISGPPQETSLLADNIHNTYSGTQDQNKYGTEARLSGMEGIYWKGPNGYTMMKLGAEYGRDGNYHRGYFGYLDDSTGKVMSWTPVRAQDSWKVIESDSRSSDNTWHNLPTDIFYSSALRFYILGVYDQSDGLAATTIVPVYPPEATPKYSKAKCTYFYNASTMRTARAEFDWANQKYKLWIEGGSDREAILIGCY